MTTDKIKEDKKATLNPNWNWPLIGYVCGVIVSFCVMVVGFYFFASSYTDKDYAHRMRVTLHNNMISLSSLAHDADRDGTLEPPRPAPGNNGLSPAHLIPQHVNILRKNDKGIYFLFCTWDFGAVQSPANYNVKNLADFQNSVVMALIDTGPNSKHETSCEDAFLSAVKKDDIVLTMTYAELERSVGSIQPIAGKQERCAFGQVYVWNNIYSGWDCADPDKEWIDRMPVGCPIGQGMVQRFNAIGCEPFETLAQGSMNADSLSPTTTEARMPHDINLATDVHPAPNRLLSTTVSTPTLQTSKENLLRQNVTAVASNAPEKAQENQSAPIIGRNLLQSSKTTKISSDDSGINTGSSNEKSKLRSTFCDEGQGPEHSTGWIVQCAAANFPVKSPAAIAKESFFSENVYYRCGQSGGFYSCRAFLLPRPSRGMDSDKSYFCAKLPQALALPWPQYQSFYFKESVYGQGKCRIDHVPVVTANSGALQCVPLSTILNEIRTIKSCGCGKNPAWNPQERKFLCS